MTPKPAEASGVSEIYELLRYAAARRQPVAATYDGQSRLLCPHVGGRKSSSLHVFCYQFGGSSNSVEPLAPEGRGVWRRLAGSESKMTGAGRGGKTVPLGHQEPISQIRWW